MLISIKTMGIENADKYEIHVSIENLNREKNRIRDLLKIENK
jgi:hypothetical protein